MPLDGHTFPLTVTDRVLRAVADSHPTHHIETADILGRRRLKHVAQARMVAVYLVRELGKHSYPKLGVIFGLDHSTCVHACHRVAEQVQSGGPLRDLAVRALAWMELQT